MTRTERLFTAASRRLVRRRAKYGGAMSNHLLVVEAWASLILIANIED